ncbi:MAG TPA: ABC-type transport auxiliary lipoprotein family protein [Rhodanobacteraceae bacterium]|nr:ABC-type transport auxiliary lipoprotein family protein [Rhodanobacteraceae bacterium]
MIRPGRILTLALLVLVGACASLTKKEPFTTYSPRYAPQPAAAGASRVDWQLAIDTPLASDTLDTSRMLVMPSPGAIETYKGGRWSDTAPLVLRTLLIQAFQDSGRIVGVGAVASGLHGDFVLSIDLYDFETQYRDGAPHAVIRLNARLGDSSVNRIAASRAFEVDAPVGGTTAADAAAAIEQAVNRLLPDIVGWTLGEGQKAWTQRASSERNAR